MKDKQIDNQYRIKLEIKLKDYDRGLNNDNYDLIIKVLKKDKRFNIPTNTDGKYKAFTFAAPGGFVISTNSYEFKGWIGSFFFAIPNKKYLNRKITKSFPTDRHRKIYLKQLHNALMSWSTHWDLFKNEPTVKFKTISNKWYIYTNN